MNHYQHTGHHHSLSLQLSNLNKEILILDHFKDNDPNFTIIDKEEQNRITQQLFHMNEIKNILINRMHHVMPTIPHNIENIHEVLDKAESERQMRHTQQIVDLTNNGETK